MRMRKPIPSNNTAPSKEPQEIPDRSQEIPDRPQETSNALVQSKLAKLRQQFHNQSKDNQPVSMLKNAIPTEQDTPQTESNETVKVLVEYKETSEIFEVNPITTTIDDFVESLVKEYHKDSATVVKARGTFHLKYLDSDFNKWIILKNWKPLKGATKIELRMEYVPIELGSNVFDVDKDGAIWL